MGYDAYISKLVPVLECLLLQMLRMEGHMLLNEASNEKVAVIISLVKIIFDIHTLLLRRLQEGIRKQLSSLEEVIRSTLFNHDGDGFVTREFTHKSGSIVVRPERLIRACVRNSRSKGSEDRQR